MNDVSAADREGFAAFLLRLRRRGITPKNLITAFEAVPRRAFLAAQFGSIAWTERMLPIECGEAMEGADVQALIIAALGLEPGHRVLEIGTGSGYTAAVMARLAARVLTIERWKTLAADAQSRFAALDIANAAVRHADGFNGVPGNDGPFDRIIVWASFDSLPRVFIDQLATGGVMITPIGPAEDAQVLAKLSKLGSRFEREDIGTVRFQPLLRGLPSVI